MGLPAKTKQNQAKTKICLLLTTMLKPGSATHKHAKAKQNQAKTQVCLSVQGSMFSIAQRSHFDLLAAAVTA